jgi:hypothetical protein
MTPNHMTQMHNPLHPGEFIEGVYQVPRWMLNSIPSLPAPSARKVVTPVNSIFGCLMEQLNDCLQLGCSS